MESLEIGIILIRDVDTDVIALAEVHVFLLTLFLTDQLHSRDAAFVCFVLYFYVVVQSYPLAILYIIIINSSVDK